MGSSLLKYNLIRDSCIFLHSTLHQCTGNTIILYLFSIFLMGSSFGVLCFYWSVIALHCCVSFCRMAACVPQHNGLAVRAHICPPSWTPSPIAALQVITEHHPELPVPCGSFLLAVSFTRGGVYVSVLLSQFVLLSPLSPLCPQFVLSICISATRFISSILLLPTYMC